MKGYIQVYTGNGKGKTTAALGLAIRAAGAGLRVFIGQFIKSGDYSEIKALKRFDDLIHVRQFGKGRFIMGPPAEEDLWAARQGLIEIRAAMASGTYNILILEEANVAVTCGLFKLDELLAVIAEKPAELEIIITGRNAHPDLIEKADLVTEMKEIKHYYQKGVPARVGIEK